MLKDFFDSYAGYESFRLGILFLIAFFFGILRFFNILPSSFFSSSLYGYYQFALFFVIACLIAFSLHKYLHKKNLEIAKRDIEELKKTKKSHH